jgi:hypothetical protein
MIGYRYFRGDFRYLRGLRPVYPLWSPLGRQEGSIIPHAL